MPADQRKVKIEIVVRCIVCLDLVWSSAAPPPSDLSNGVRSIIRRASKGGQSAVNEGVRREVKTNAGVGWDARE
jgi:hypothetical protein